MIFSHVGRQFGEPYADLRKTTLLKAKLIWFFSVSPKNTKSSESMQAIWFFWHQNWTLSTKQPVFELFAHFEIHSHSESFKISFQIFPIKLRLIIFAASRTYEKSVGFSEKSRFFVHDICSWCSLSDKLIEHDYIASGLPLLCGVDWAYSLLSISYDDEYIHNDRKL